MRRGIEVQKPDGRFVRFIENDPRRPQEYEEFRRIAAHLQWLNDHRQLFVRPLVFEETLVADFKSIPRAEDINNGFNMGLRWRQKPNGNYELTNACGDKVEDLKHAPQLDRPLDGEIATRSIRLNIQIDESARVLLDLFVEFEALLVGQSHRVEIGDNDASPFQTCARHQSSTSVRTHGPERWTSGRLRR